MTKVCVRAPSNIALTKYMGKTDPSRNLPANPSVSMTLRSLCTELEIQTHDEDEVISKAMKLSEEGRLKFLRHWTRLKRESVQLFEKFEIPYRPLEERVMIHSQNTFPAGAGIASSASSFGALTFGFFFFYSQDQDLFLKVWAENRGLREAVSSLARLGSGSACRSLMGPFVSWENDRVKEVESALPPLVDIVILAGSEVKKVGSSEAHARVLTSPLWLRDSSGRSRVERATERHKLMLTAIRDGNFQQLARTSYEEFLDMHELFHTSVPSFSYWNENTKRILDFFRAPDFSEVCLTMDAGPNVHCIVPARVNIKWIEILQNKFPDLPLLGDAQGKGAERGFPN